MGRRLIPSSQTRAYTAGSLASKFQSLPPKYHNQRPKNPSNSSLYFNQACCFCCKSSFQARTPMDKYKESFSNQMALAGLKPNHPVAIGVSGGPDSTALCVLAAAWKMEGSKGVFSAGGFIDGLLAIVVDHGLRPESEDEALIVSRRISQLGIRCEIASCTWSHGKPKQGHLQEEARDVRYQKLQTICLQHQIGVLLIAHHADDQAELFILRLSRNSGVLGLAGMALASQIFSTVTPLHYEVSKNEGILLVRPLLQFSKEDMYKVCQVAGQDWVEDPTNRSSLYARNRIRMSLGNLVSFTFKSELQALISACRKTRSFVDQVCYNLINHAVTVKHQYGYAIIDLEILNPSKVMDICLAKFVALVLQFISQRQKAVRGRASKLLLDYIRTFPCKTSITAAGCYLCPAPGSRGTKVLVCCSVDCPLPSEMKLTGVHSNEELRQFFPSELRQILADAKSYLDRFVPDSSDVYFLDSSSESVLSEAKRVNIISESTYRNILLLQRNEAKHFKVNTGDNVKHESKDEYETLTESLKKQFRPGQICYFMNRFLISWKLGKHNIADDVSVKSSCGSKLGGDSWHCYSWSCTMDHNMSAEVRHIIEYDWLYLAKLSKSASFDDLDQQRIDTLGKMGQAMAKNNIYLDYLRFSADKALMGLKCIPVAARRSLPALVSHQGQLLSIPSIGFKSCPCLIVSCEFKPRVPLGGGFTSFF